MALFDARVRCVFHGCMTVSSPGRAASTALSRLTVIDLTRVRAGPTCVRQFADWGANVVEIEMPDDGAGDFSARHTPDFQNLHRNKRSITLDLKTPQGIEILKRLVARADVLVENYRPDVKHRLGIDYETLRAVNSRLVYASISGFGQDGPYRERPGVDQIAQGMGGLMSITGEPGRGPMRVGIPVADLAGLFAALGIFVALMEREASGEGQWVQTSLLQAQIFMLDFQAARWLMAGEVPGQAGNNHPTGTPTGTFKTRDGHINIAPTPPMWRRFCKAMGLEHIADDPGFATPPARTRNRERINAIIEELTVREDSATWIARLNEAGIPGGPIHTVDQAFADDQVRHLGIAQRVVSAALGEISLVGQPVILSRTGSRLAAAAPQCGENTGEILAELGYTEDEVAAFRRANVV